MPVIALQSSTAHQHQLDLAPSRPEEYHDASYFPSHDPMRDATASVGGRGEVSQRPQTPPAESVDGRGEALLPVPVDLTSPSRDRETPLLAIPTTTPQGNHDDSALHLVSDARSREPTLESHTEAGPSEPRQIPPPPNPRRHRSGVLMSRVRAHSGGTSFKTSVTGSKSFGDLSAAGFGGFGGTLGMSSMDQSEEVLESVTGHYRSRESSIYRGEGRRVMSDGSRRGSDEADDTMWDNSARFYHHLHSRPPSRQPSPETSPKGKLRDRDPSPSASPLYVRRSMTLPHNGPGPPGTSLIPPIVDPFSAPAPTGSHPSAALSPNHQFLQQHLPPTFPHAPGAPASGTLVVPSHPMVILTPTTAEWKELQKEYSSVEGESMSDGSDFDRRSSLGSRSSEEERNTKTSPGMFDLHRADRPLLRSTMSAEVLSAEESFSRDPASPERQNREPTPVKPIFTQNVIEATPIPPSTPQMPSIVSSTHPAVETIPPLEEPGLDEKAFGFSVDDETAVDDESIPAGAAGAGHDDSPVRFASIGRRESLRIVKRPGVKEPRKKTKRELERERLFKDLDEELAQDQENPSMPRWNSVTEIGAGGGLDGSLSSPSSPDQSSDDGKMMALQLVLNEPEPDSPPSKKPESPEHPSLAIPRTASLSPSQPFRPSPLHTTPLTAPHQLPSPLSSDASDSPLDSRGPSPASMSGSTANLDTIRDYAKSLSAPHHSDGPSPDSSVDGRAPALTSTMPPPKSTVSLRKRDTTRVSLVAGRVVQPFSIPASTALPAPAPERPPIAKKNSFGSFSPFRSPSLGAARSSGTPPSFMRFDSTISIAPSTGAPSPVGTPTSETAGGMGGRGIDDYVILSEAGKGAYGLVMRAKVKGPKGEPVGDEIIIKYIVKARILADCWKKHKVLGPIPVEIHVMDQIRHLMYHTPTKPHPWDPSRHRPGLSSPAESLRAESLKADSTDSKSSRPETPDTPFSISSNSSVSLWPNTQKYLAGEIKVSPERGHPNICKLLDFFEDREFYYMVMPRFGAGLDLFDRVEASPSGLDPFDIRSLIGQLADAIRFLHANGIVHRDIKDENVILDGHGKCQLIDFGSAAHWRPGKRWDTFSGTLHYASPEILRGEMYGGKEQDVYALGTVMYVLLVGETPFGVLPDEVLEGLKPGTSAEEALEERAGGEHADEGKESDGGGRLGDAADLVRQCLAMEVGERPTAEHVCGHRFLKGEGGWTGFKGWIKPKN